MKVLITGAAGVLGTTVTALMASQPNLEINLTDLVEVDSPYPFTRADLSAPGEASRLCDGMDALVHIASIHPWKEYSPDQYIDFNIKGTYNILDAAAASSVSRVVLTSSIAAMGMRPNPDLPLPWTESKPCTPDDLYAITKHTGEQLCRFFAGDGNYTYVILRPGTFIPKPEDDPGYGLGLLTSWLHVSDVAAAHVLALEAPVRNEDFVITAGFPFSSEDASALVADAASVILKHFPRARELESLGIGLPASIGRCYDIRKARRLLGYTPHHTFARWLENMVQGGSR